MSRRRRSQISGQFSPRLVEMLESPAYRVLSLAAHRVLARVEIELAHHGGTDNGKLPVTYDDFEKYGIHRHAIAPAIKEAVALGFLEITQRGRAGNADWRTPSLYRLTYRHADGLPGDGTHEWRKRGNDLKEAGQIAKMARKAKPEKTKVQWRKTPVLGGGKRTENSPIHSADSATTCFSADSVTTINTWGRGRVMPTGKVRGAR